MKNKTAVSPDANPAQLANKATSTPPTNDGMRETVESVVVAFVLAFLFKTFTAEAFVIPTGSMAPTLMGRHKDVHCEKCNFPYRVTAKPEVDDEGRRYPDKWMTASVCPNCGYIMSLASQTKDGSFPSFSGDRILVAKFPYDIGDPERWDVVVFKYPVRAQQNFIKRLVGLPNETVRILRGDIYIKGKDQSGFTIARKPPDKVQAVMQTVYDNDYALPAMIEKGWPARWQSWALPVEEAAQKGFPDKAPPLAGTEDGWATSADYQTFQIKGATSRPAWLRYTHTPPSPEDWKRMDDGQSATPVFQQIVDFNAYNMGFSNHGGRPHSGPEHWVGDLAVQCEVQVQSDTGVLVLELVEGGVRFQCRIDVATGEAKLSNSADEAFQPPPQMTKIKGRGTYRLSFANFDDQLLLWVDGQVIPFEATYHPLGNNEPLAIDYSPVGIAAEGLDAKVSHLRIVRDIYYIASRGESFDNQIDGEDFPLEDDQFFVLGDNSAESLDARYWQETPFGPPVRYVDRDLMIGKALLIYWPHGLYEIPGTGIPFYLPIVNMPLFPNFERMGYVR